MAYPSAGRRGKKFIAATDAIDTAYDAYEPITPETITPRHKTYATVWKGRRTITLLKCHRGTHISERCS